MDISAEAQEGTKSEVRREKKAAESRVAQRKRGEEEKKAEEQPMSRGTCIIDANLRNAGGNSERPRVDAVLL